MRTLMFTVIVRVSVMKRNFHEHGRPMAWAAGDNDFAAEQSGALAHAEQADGFGVRDLRFGNAAAIVLGFEQKLAATLLQMHGHFCGVGMANDVRERFLENAEESGVQV